MRRRREPIDAPFLRLPKVRRRRDFFEEMQARRDNDNEVEELFARIREPEVQPRSTTKDETIVDTNKSLLATSKFSDLKFQVGPQKVEIQAHKLILMSRSSVFAAMLDNDDRWVEAQAGVIQLPDVDPDDFKLFLEFVYTDAFKATMCNVMQILDLAVKYHIPALVEKCSGLAKKSMSLENCICIYECARMYGQTALETAAFHYISISIDNVIKHPSFVAMKKETLIALISKEESLFVREVEFFQVILKWAVEECGRQKLDPITQNQRIVLTGVLEIFKFTNMTAKEFTLNVADVGILTAEEENKVYRQICRAYQDINPLWDNWD